MNQSIFKYVLENTDRQKIIMPQNARILCVQPQNGKPCIWAIVKAFQPNEEREFEIYGTGNPFYENAHYGKETTYIGTYQLSDIGFVGHLFELVKI